MKTEIYCIYRENETYPYKAVSYLPIAADIDDRDRICRVILELNLDGKPTSLEFNEDNECYLQGALLRIYEVNTNGELILLGDKQGYSHKKARSIIKNLNIAYPSKKYILTRAFEAEEDEQ